MLESNDFYLFKFQSNTIRPRPKIIPDGSCCRRRACFSPCKLIEIFEKINPLQTTKNGRGIVSVRVALLLRNTEIKPCSLDLSRLYTSIDMYDMDNSSLHTRFVTTHFHITQTHIKKNNSICFFLFTCLCASGASLYITCYILSTIILYFIHLSFCIRGGTVWCTCTSTCTLFFFVVLPVPPLSSFFSEWDF